MVDSSPRVILVRDLRGNFDTRREHARAALGGAEHRVFRGAYLSSADWARLDARERHVLMARAMIEARGVGILSHFSAAAVHGLPLIGRWPDRVHSTVPRTAGGRSSTTLVRHSRILDADDVVHLDGVAVTSIERTILDMATAAPFATAVAMADRALHLDRRRDAAPMTTTSLLLGCWERSLPFRGHQRARAVIDFAVTRADSPLESLSRCTMREIGCPPPRLQTRFFDRDGFIGETDFDWPEFGVIGEADGDTKYLDESKRSGRSVEQVVLDEKIREDRLRALPRNMARWRWNIAADPRALRLRLERAGVRW